MAEPNIKDLVKKRASIKSKLTQFSTFLNLFNDANFLSHTQTIEIQCRLTRIENLYDDFDGLQNDIEILSENADEAYSEREEFESLYYAQVSAARALLSPQPLPARSRQGSESSDRNTDRKHDFVRLPKIDLPHFDGDYQRWLEFRDTYLSLIHTNNSINPINKYHYLRAALSGTAASVIQSLDFRSENYDVAWQLLSERFDNERLLVNNHVQALFNFNQLQIESSTSLRSMIDTTNKNLRSLESLGQPTDHWDTLVIYMMAKKLDAVSNRKWEEQRNNYKGFPTLQQFNKFLSDRADLLDSIHINCKQTNSKSSSVPQKISFPQKPKSFLTATKNITCPLCSEAHHLFSCQAFRALDINSRIRVASEHNVCKNCLRLGHSENKCSLSHCKYCQIKHNTLLHKDIQTDAQYQPSNNIALSTSVSSNSHCHVLLSTALVKVSDINGTLHTARLLLDNGSTSNFMTEQLCDKLGLVRRNTSSTVSGINNHYSNTSESCDVAIESCFGGYRANLNCLILPKITNSLPGSYVDIQHVPIPLGLQLADPTFNVPSSIDILVGAHIFWEVLQSNFISLGPNQPKLHASKLGWLLSGCVYKQTLSNQIKVCHFVSTVSQTQSDESQLTRFWELDTISTNRCLSKEEQACERNFKETTRRDDNGRFVVSIPLKDSPEVLGDSYVMAKCRFLSLERKLERDLNFKQQYLQFMKEYENLGHMTKNIEKSQAKINYYLPHHGVVRESSTTTKLRVVFDASAATTSGKCLNSIQNIGPTVQDDLLSILLRFRQHKYVVSSDIQKMYRAIMVEPSQRMLQQIVFRYDASEPIQTFTLNTVTYGTASAPYLATKCLVSLADDCPDPSARESIKKDFYVDDYLSGGDSIESVIKLCNHVISTLETANFFLHKWKSNCPEILNSILPENEQTSEKTLNLNDTSPSKTLGLYWDSTSDILFFSIQLETSEKITKRVILSLISQIFDPLGLVGPVVVQAKIILQQLWVHKCEWDDEVPNTIKHDFTNFIRSLPTLNLLRIHRWISCHDNPALYELHIFTDSSERCYGACVYVRTVKNDSSTCVRLLASKNKVAPLKPTTIPRLELCGALLGTRLYQKIIKSLTITIDKCYFWCDSTIVLGWLKTPVSQLKPFVRNRVSEIQDSTERHTWSYVPSKQNPADLVSRGVTSDFISTSALWWSGPDFLHKREIEFPSRPNIQLKELPETTLHITSYNVATPENVIIQLIHKSSNFTKLIRVYAYLQRFIFNCKNRNNRILNHLTSAELQSAHCNIIHIAQKEMFSDEYIILKSNQTLPKKNRLISLTPFIDCNNLIRVGGRLRNSYYDYDLKHPLLLCSKHHITRIILESKHKALFHAGPQTLLANIRQSYWPLGGRNLAKRIVHSCVRCTRFNTKPAQIIMGDLPTDRTQLEFPFLKTGVDYAGPVLIADRKGRGSKLQKAYICVFVCFAVKAVHLELVTDLTKEAFLAAFNRFISRRGKPSTMYSDNGTSFVGGFNELARFLQANSDNLESEIAQLNIDFKFTPAYSPHFGGLWEAAVKSVKHLLRRTLTMTHLTYEEFSTCLIQIEAILNSRPLTPLSSDPSDLSYLSPSQFLIGRPLMSIPHPDINNGNINRLQRFQRVELLKQHFWKRYSNEYISGLQAKQKWHSSRGEDLKIGAMVLLRDATRPPLLWLMGRITNLHIGRDGISRVADIFTKKGIITRAYNNICPLPILRL